MIAAIILAAGESKRMGQPKMLLPWGEATVLEHVLSVFAEAGIEDIVVVVGALRDRLEAVVSGCEKRFPVRSVYNENFEKGEMLSSLQCGLRDLSGRTIGAALIGLGDQPQVQKRSVQLICNEYRERKPDLIVPSFQMRRGHPWLAARPLWNELLEMTPPESPRNFLNRHAGEIRYLNVDTPNILSDLDTPEDYRAARP